MPIPCPLEEAPEGYLKCNGAAFDKERYPELAEGYPSGVLPDLRGEFIRGWDDGRGVDAGRKLLSLQSHAFESHNHYLPSCAGSVPAPNTRYASLHDSAWTTRIAVNREITATPDMAVTFPLTKGDLTNIQQATGDIGTFGTETRPRNIAFLYIVRAA